MGGAVIGFERSARLGLWVTYFDVWHANRAALCGAKVYSTGFGFGWQKDYVFDCFTYDAKKAIEFLLYLDGNYTASGLR